MINSLNKVGINFITNMSKTIKPRVVFVLGRPGAGKGTMCARIVKEFEFVHLSAGDLLREERKKPGTIYGELIETHIRNGTIVPVEITCKLIENAMLNAPTNKFLIDGFPRNKDNLDGWKREMENKVEFLFVLFLECNEKICTERCLKRGAEGSGRSDDNEESLKKRIQTFYNESLPIVDYYRTLNLVRTVDAGRAPDVVFNDIKKIFSQIE